jgi:hypothetical protein
MYDYDQKSIIGADLLLFLGLSLNCTFNSVIEQYIAWLWSKINCWFRSIFPTIGGNESKLYF